MKVSMETTQVLVIDDFLSKSKFKNVSEYSSRQPVRSVHSENYEKVWTVDDGNPLGGPVMLVKIHRQNGVVHIQKKRSGERGYVYPTGTALDSVFRKLLIVAVQSEKLLGKPAADWPEISARLFKYPYGAGLDWHNDSQEYTGAFTYYTHATWKSTWGGELLLSQDERPSHRRSLFAEKFQDGIYVLPRPNRLVLIKGGVWHKIAKVGIEAGRNMREALSGFFKRTSLHV